MNRCIHSALVITVSFLICTIFLEKAYAYLDPGTGSYLLQMVVAGLIGGLFAIKVFWKKIKSFFKNLFSSD